MVHLIPLWRLLALAALLVGFSADQNEAFAQCNGGRGTSTGSASTLTTSAPYSPTPLVTGGYPQNNLLALQYQQRVLAVQNQIASMVYQNAQKQRLAMAQREAQARPYRLARAEAKRAARAERAAARLRQKGQSSNAYTFASTKKGEGGLLAQ